MRCPGCPGRYRSKQPIFYGCKAFHTEPCVTTIHRLYSKNARPRVTKSRKRSISGTGSFLILKKAGYWPLRFFPTESTSGSSSRAAQHPIHFMVYICPTARVPRIPVTAVHRLHPQEAKHPNNSINITCKIPITVTGGFIYEQVI